MWLPTTSLRSFASLAGILAALVIALATPGTAAAGEYTISICQADEAGYVSAAFENFATRGMKWRRACNPLGPGLRGLVTTNVPGTGRVPRGAQSGFVLNAPPGTAISRLRWSGVAHRRDCRYALQLYAERPDASTVAIKNVRANHRCPNPESAQASSWPRLRAYDLGGASRIVQRVVCVGTTSHEYCSARGQNYIGTLAAEATVVDESPPSAAVIQERPLASGAWVSGRQSFDYEASDNVGVKSASALVGGSPRGGDSRSCDYSQRIPCPDGRGTIQIDTNEAPEGSQPLAVVAEDAAGNRAESAPVTVRIDNAAPGAVPVAVGGGEAWRNGNDFDLAWSNPAEPDRAPITAAHYRLCHVGGNECSTAESSGEGIAAIDGVKVPSPGEWEVRLWREDAAGNQQPANASEPVRLRFDPEPPQLGFETPRADDPTRISVLATDRVSGVGGGEIEISRAGSGTWQVLATSREGDHLVTRVDDAALPAGEYELRASASDLANNFGATEHRLDGQPMVLRLPLRTTTAMKAGVVDRRIVTRKGRKGKVRRTILEPHRTVSFGSRVRLGGRLVNSAGHPLSGAKVLVYSERLEGKEPVAGTEEQEGAVATDSDGRFVYPVEARSSQQFRFVYEGTATILPVEAAATLLVKATSTFSVKPKHVLNGGSVTFGGRVKGRPLPEAGKLVELQVELTNEWQTFRTVRTDSTGSWQIPYSFRRTCGDQHFHFRVHLPGEAGYPLEPGNSHELTVRVRGRPC